MISPSIRIVTLLATGVSFISGFTYLLMKYTLKPLGEFSIINHQWQSSMLKAHILSSVILTFMFGMITSVHTIRYFKIKKKGKGSGTMMLVIIVFSISSGFIIQTFGEVSMIEYLRWSHSIVSFAMTLLFAIHLTITSEKKVRFLLSFVSLLLVSVMITYL